MEPVSSGWIAAHKETLLPETFIEITYSVTEPGLHEEASVSASEEETYSDVSHVVDLSQRTGMKYATLENGLWGLDGSFSYRSESYVEQGYVSDSLSGADGSFATPPTITISFATKRATAIPGFTITWSNTFNEWATDFVVSTYYGNTKIAQTSITGNTSPHTEIQMEVVDYNRITIEILKWSLPYHRARCSSVFLGLETVYSKNDLMGYEHTQFADLLSATLPKNEIVFRLRNDDKRWNPDNPTGVEKYLLEQQEVSVRYGMTVNGETEWIKGGTFWLSEWSTPANGLEASFTARDAFGFMNETYAGPRNGTLYDVALAAFQAADLPAMSDGTQRYKIDASLQNITTDFSADTGDYTIAEVLQMVAHAGNCVLYQDRSGLVHIEPWATQYSGFMIGPEISYAHPEYTISKPLKAISVGYGENLRHVVGVAGKGETQTVDNIMVNTQDDALRVGTHARDILQKRKVISGEFRADVRLDVLEPVIVTSKYASNIIGVTEVVFSVSGGAVRGKYTGRVVSVNLSIDDRRSGEFYLGEV